MIRGRQRESIEQRPVGRDRLRRLEAFPIPAAEDVGRHHQLIAAHLRLRRDLVRIDVDHLHDPVGIGAARRRDQVHLRLAADLQWRFQHVRDEGDDIRPARRFSLIVDQPLRPRAPAGGLNRPGAVGHRLRGIGEVLVERRVSRLRCGEIKFQSRGEIERRGLNRAAARAPGRPRRQSTPGVGAGLEGRDGRQVRFRRALLEVVIQEWTQDIAAELQPRIGAKFQRAERAAVRDFLAVMPRAHHQEYLVVGGVLRLDRVVDRDRAVDVLLIPETVDQHHRDGRRLRRQQLVHRLIAPERVVARMLEQLAPEADLLEPAAAPELARRSRLHEHVVLVVVALPPVHVGLARRFLVVDVAHHLLAERPVVEPVVAHPAVDHRVHRHRHLQRRVRVEERHQRQESVVGNPEDADPAVGFRHVLHEPVDRVVGVGRMIDRGRVLRPAQRPVHHVIAFGAVLAAHVLHRADVAAFDDHVGGVVIALQDRAEMAAVGVARQARRVVGRPRQQDRRASRALRHDHDRVQLHAVAHRDHHDALDVVEAVVHRLERCRRLARQAGRGGRLLCLRRRWVARRGEQHRTERQRKRGESASACDGCHGSDSRKKPRHTLSCLSW